MRIIFFALVLLEVLSGAEVDLITPSIPDLRSAFGLSVSEVEMILTVNLVVYSISAFIIGNVADKYGTKITIITSLIVFIFGIIISATSSTYFGVLIGRLFQGFGIAGPAILAYVIITEVYSPHDQPRLMCVMSGWTTIVMAFVPICGSYTTLLYGWRGNFMALLTLAVIVTIICSKLLPQNQKPKERLGISLREYKPIVKSSRAMYFIVTMAFLCAPYWVFVGIAPIFYMQAMHVPLQEFGYYQGFISIVFGSACFASNYVLQKFGTRRCFDVSIAVTAIATLTMLVLAVLKVQNPIIITITFSIISAGVMLPINILYPLGLCTIEGAKGRIASFMHSTRLMMTAFSVQLVAYIYHGAFLEIAVVLACIMLIGLAGARILGRDLR